MFKNTFLKTQLNVGIKFIYLSVRCKATNINTTTASMATLSNTFSPNSNKSGIMSSPIEELIKTPKDRPFRVAIEGNIGVGKSTLIKYFQDFPGIETYGEPIEWWRNCGGHNLLDLMYTNIQDWLKVFQSYVQLTRLKIQTSKPNNPSTRVQIFERSIQNNRYCFVEQAHKNGLISPADYAVIDEWYKWMKINFDISLDLIVYLRSTPEVVYQRVKRRGRPEESGLSYEYLEQLHESHESWLMNTDGYFEKVPILILDANQTLEEIKMQYKQHEKTILGYEKMGALKINGGKINKIKQVLTLD